MHCTICNLPTINIVGSTLPQCKCGWQKPNSPVTQRTWVGLTDEEKIKLWNRAEKRQAYQGVPAFMALIQEVEAKLKDKNL